MRTEEAMEQWTNDHIAVLVDHVAQGGWDQARHKAGQISRELTAYCKEREVEARREVQSRSKR